MICGTFFKSLLPYGSGLAMPGPGRQLAPAVARQQPIDRRLGHRVAHSLFVGPLHRAYFQHAALLGAGAKPLQQSLFGFPRQILMPTTATSPTFQHGLAFA